MTLCIEEAFNYYRQHILAPILAKRAIYNKRRKPLEGAVPPRDWEVFAAILVDDEGGGTYGADLRRYEVKSSQWNRRFEYQYHRKSGLQKLEEDRRVNHVYIFYKNDYQDLDVYILSAEHYARASAGWEAGYTEAYSDPRNQRYRPAISRQTALTYGMRVMRILNGQLVALGDEPVALRLFDAQDNLIEP